MTITWNWMTAISHNIVYTDEKLFNVAASAADHI
jgi:hypothetical protein